MARIVCIVFVLVGVFAPVFAAETPIVLRHEGEWAVPQWSGERRAPDGQTWREFWLDPERDQDDSVVVMPFCSWDPATIDHDAILRTAGSVGRDGHWFGVDRYGRDIASRLVHATRTAVVIGGLTAFFAFLIGLAMGYAAAFGPGILRAIVDRLTIVTMAFPVVIAAVAVAAVWSGGTLGTVLLLTAFFWPPIARNARAELRRQRQLPRIETARSLGYSSWRILRHHAGPELWRPLLTLTVFVCIDSIFVESALSFLGVGLGSDSISYGGILRDGRLAALNGAGTEQWLPAAVSISAFVLALHGVAGGRRSDFVQPRSNNRNSASSVA
ncbi:MAG: ABC transporter permease [Planctomycetota bacterium]